MKFRPILFSTPMVKALLDGRKKQTRRIWKSKHAEIAGPPGSIHPDGSGLGWAASWPASTAGQAKEMYPGNVGFACPHGTVGNILWVREEHYRYGQWTKNGLTETGRQRWRFYPDSQFKEIRYFDNPPATVEKNSHRSTGWYKRLARFMPKSACRIFLKIEDIRVERLQDISEADAIAEGIKSFRPVPGDGPPETQYYHYVKDKWGPSPIHSYQTLWEKINKSGSWEANPFVWAISFTRIDKPENFL